MINWQALCLKNDFNEKTPVCASCKKTNRTRTFCRERHKHRHLPWSTVYVVLSAVDATDPSTVVAAPSHMTNNEDEGVEATGNKSNSTGGSTANRSEVEEDVNNLEETDDIYAIEPSRTFLAQVSCTSNSIHWLQKLEGENTLTTTESDVKALNDAIRSPVTHPDMNQMSMHPQPYYPMLNPEQQQHYFQQQQQQFAAWHAQYGQHMMMPPPMMMAGPPHPPPPHPMINSPTNTDENDNRDHNEGGVSGPDDNSSPNRNTEDNEKEKNDFDPIPSPGSVSNENNRNMK